MDKSLDEIISDRFRETGGAGRNRRFNNGGVSKGGYRRGRNGGGRERNGNGREGNGYDRERNGYDRERNGGDRNSGRSGPRYNRGPHGKPRPDFSHTIKITNLHYELSEDDIYDLLTRVGPVRRVRLQYDPTGRSDGIAYANFQDENDAMEAVKRYDGKKAAGLEITVRLLDQSALLRNRLSVPNRDKGQSQDSDDNDSWSRGKPHQQRKTLEELDAELNEYMSGRNAQDSDPKTAEDEHMD